MIDPFDNGLLSQISPQNPQRQRTVIILCQALMDIEEDLFSHDIPQIATLFELHCETFYVMQARYHWLYSLLDEDSEFTIRTLVLYNAARRFLTHLDFRTPKSFDQCIVEVAGLSMLGQAIYDTNGGVEDSYWQDLANAYPLQLFTGIPPWSDFSF